MAFDGEIPPGEGRSPGQRSNDVSGEAARREK
jgi:hypothetical protein